MNLTLTTVSHPRFTELLEFLDRQLDDLAAAVATVPAVRRRESPGHGRWSAAEVLEHIALVEQRIAGRFTTWVDEARARGLGHETDSRPILPGIKTDAVLDRTRRVVAPEPARPTGRLDADEAWRAVETSRDAVKRAVVAADGLAIGQIVQPHPALGPITLYGWIAFVGSHMARHATQIREVGAMLASQHMWASVDQYISSRLMPADGALDATLTASSSAGLPSIQVAPNQGKLLQTLARMVGARTILEIGTLGGYSAIWLARALAPGGRLVTLEADPRHAEVARANIRRAGLDDLVEVRLGPALETLPSLSGVYDFIFIDADKPNIPDYFTWALRLSHPGTVIVVDNVVREGQLADASSVDPNVVGVRRLHDLLAAEPRVSATTIQTVGSKGYDGFTIATVL